MVLDEDQGITTFIDTKFGEKYFMRTLPEVTGQVVIFTWKYGWLLVFGGELTAPIFFNPFTKVCIQLPELGLSFKLISSFTFSGLPTSPHCIVVAFTTNPNEPLLIHFMGKPVLEYRDIPNDILIPYALSSHTSPIFYGGNLHIFCQYGELGILRFDQDCEWETRSVKPSTSTVESRAQGILVDCGNDLLLITMGEFGQWVEVFKLNHSKLLWEKVYDIGEHMIYVWERMCFCVVSKIPEMKNKIYFPGFGGGNIVFYYLDTYKFHTFEDKSKGEVAFMDFFRTQERLMAVWIDPTCSS